MRHVAAVLAAGGDAPGDELFLLEFDIDTE